MSFISLESSPTSSSPVDSAVLKQRLLQSLEIGSALQVSKASATLSRLRAQDDLASIFGDLRATIEECLVATELLVRVERPQWAAAIRAELGLLKQLPATP